MSVHRQSPVTLRRGIVTDLDLDGFPLRGYRDEEYLQAALAAGYDVTTLAQAHDVAKKTIYRALEALAGETNVSLPLSITTVSAELDHALLTLTALPHMQRNITYRHAAQRCSLRRRV